MPGLMHGICDLPPMNAASLAYCAENREMESSYRLHLTSMPKQPSGDQIRCFQPVFEGSAGPAHTLSSRDLIELVEVRGSGRERCRRTQAVRAGIGFQGRLTAALPTSRQAVLQESKFGLRVSNSRFWRVRRNDSRRTLKGSGAFIERCSRKLMRET
jgi:hypothetical protein